MNDILIDFKSCTIGYETPLIEGLNLSVARGEILSVVGPTGIGKSTILRLVGDVDTKGRRPVIMKGEMVVNLSSKPGIVFQSLEQLLPWKDALHNAALPFLSGQMDISRDEALKRAGRLLNEVGLAGHEDKFPKHLSGGMRQRVAIARALFSEPELMIMDEPFGSLDSITRRKLQDLLLSVHKAHGMTVIFVTHDIEEAVRLSDRILSLSRSGKCSVYSLGETKANDIEQIKREILNDLGAGD